MVGCYKRIVSTKGLGVGCERQGGRRLFERFGLFLKKGARMVESLAMLDPRARRRSF